MSTRSCFDADGQPPVYEIEWPEPAEVAALCCNDYKPRIGETSYRCIIRDGWNVLLQPMQDLTLHELVLDVPEPAPSLWLGHGRKPGSRMAGFNRFLSGEKSEHAMRMSMGVLSFCCATLCDAYVLPMVLPRVQMVVSHPVRASSLLASLDEDARQRRDAAE